MKTGNRKRWKKILRQSPKLAKAAKKWKKAVRHAGWLPRLYRKRKRIGDAVYSVMYLAANYKK